MGSENQLSVDTLEMSNDLGSSVLRLRKLIERGRDIGGDIAHKEEVSLINVLSKSIDEHRSLFPGISFSFEPECARHISLALPGGEETLARVLTNILRNACQGDGVTAASHVDVSVSRDGEHECVTLLVRDDGPGFSEEQLNTPISYFQTTKVDGSGLGLYTTHRLMAASRGQLLYANRSTGGAEVSIVFPLAK